MGNVVVTNIRTVAKFREIASALDLQHDDTHNVVLRVEAVFTAASLPGPSRSASLLFDVLRNNGL